MHLLNGDQIYIKPVKVCGTFIEELQDCLSQLSDITWKGKIFKLNFFIDTPVRESYAETRRLVLAEVSKKVTGNIVISVIAQPPVSRKVIVECCFYNPSTWDTELISDDENGAILFINGSTRILVGNVQSFVSESCRENSDLAFRQLSNIFVKGRFPISSIVRQWNYISDILGFDGKEQRYQGFNNIRAAFYGNSFDGKGYPAATAIGMNHY
jgi:hypothetical protein